MACVSSLNICIDKMGARDKTFTGSDFFSGSGLSIAFEKLLEAVGLLEAVERTRGAGGDMDERFLEKLKKREHGAVVEFVESNQERLLRSALLLCRDRALAEDLTQETFLKALGSLDRFEGRSDLFTWLYRILYNKFKDYKRREVLFRRYRERKKSNAAGTGEACEPEGRLGVDEEAIRKERLRAAVDRLSEKHRRVLILRYYERMSYEKIAWITGTGIGTVRSRLHYAHKKLRKLLERGEEHEL